MGFWEVYKGCRIGIAWPLTALAGLVCVNTGQRESQRKEVPGGPSTRCACSGLASSSDARLRMGNTWTAGQLTLRVCHWKMAI